MYIYIYIYIYVYINIYIYIQVFTYFSNTFTTFEKYTTHGISLVCPNGVTHNVNLVNLIPLFPVAAAVFASMLLYISPVQK